MVVVKDQRFNSRIGMMAFDTGAYGRQFALMHDFIAFQVKGPVAGAGVLGNHFLLRIDKAAIGHALVPQGFNDSYLGVCNSSHARKRIVGALADRHHKLIDQGQQGADRGLKGKGKVYAVAYEGETTD